MRSWETFCDIFFTTWIHVRLQRVYWVLTPAVMSEYNLEAQLRRNVGDLECAAALVADIEFVHERPVNLYLIAPEALQVAEGRIARVPKIVYGHSIAARLQHLDRAARLLDVSHRRRFGNSEHAPRRIDAGRGDQGIEPRDEVRHIELDRREI